MQARNETARKLGLLKGEAQKLEASPKDADERAKAAVLYSEVVAVQGFLEEAEQLERDEGHRMKMARAMEAATYEQQMTRMRKLFEEQEQQRSDEKKICIVL